jgi:hypothetical protein
MVSCNIQTIVCKLNCFPIIYRDHYVSFSFNWNRFTLKQTFIDKNIERNIFVAPV